MRASRKGFTLIETMAALVVLLLASVGALVGLIAASKGVKDSQARQYEAALAEAHAQDQMFINKAVLTASSNFVAFPHPELLPIGSAPWQLDAAVTPADVDITTSPPTFYDLLGRGRFFTVDRDGVVTPMYPDPGWTSCADPNIPVGTFCREILVMQGVQQDPSAVPAPNVPPGTTQFTLWTRVSRVGNPIDQPDVYAVTHREVVVQ